MKRLLFSFLFVLTTIAGWAEEPEPTTFTQGDFTYTVTDADAKTVSIAKAEAATLTGALVIPTSVTEAEVTYAVTSVGASGFNGTGITSVTIPASVTSIGNSAFQFCGSLASITIPASVDSVGSDAFYDCDGLTTITIENSGTALLWKGTDSHPLNQVDSNYSLYLGRNLTTQGNQCFFPGATSVVIGNQVTAVNPNLFEGATKLANVTMGSGVTTIGQYAFRSTGTDESVTAQSITLGANVTTIREGAFYGCSKLTTLDLGTNLTAIPDNMLFSCSALTCITIPASVDSVGSNAFYDCDGLDTITIVNSGTALLWKGTDSHPLNEVHSNYSLYLGRNLTTQGNQCFFPGATSVVIGDQVTAVNPYLFDGATKLANVTMGSGVTTIGEYAFKNTGSDVSVGTQSITLGANVTTIREGAFYGCSKLTTLDLGTNLTAIPDNMLFSCSALTSITIPASVDSVGSNAFYDCDGLDTITIENSGTALLWKGTDSHPLNQVDSNYSLYLGRNLTTQGNQCFFPGATSVVIGDQVTAVNPYLFAGATKLANVTMGSGVTTIGEYAFQNTGTDESVKAQSITLGANVTTIRDRAFYGCSKLTTLDLGTKLTAIPDNMLFSCSALTSITIPASVDSVGSNAFYDCDGLDTITIENSGTALLWKGTDSHPLNQVHSNYSLYLGRNLTTQGNQCFFPGATSVVIGNQVTAVNPNLFEGATKLANVTIGSGVTTIGDAAFNGCGTYWDNETDQGVEELVVTMGNNVTSIGVNAFRDCTKLKSILLSSKLASIGDGAFYNCSALTGITIPASVQTIGDQVFYYVDNMQNFTIEDSNTSLTIGDLGYGFSGENFYLGRDVTYNSKLNGQLVYSNTQHVTIGPNVTTLNDNMFYVRNRIKSVDLTNATSLTTIGDNVFHHCDSLENISIPATVTSIGYEAFLYTDRLNNVIFEDGDATLIMDSSIGSGLCGQSMYLGRNISGPTTRFIWTDCKTLTVGPKVTTLYANMFKASALETIDLTNATSLTTLGADVFGNCANLTNVKVGWLTPLAIDDNAFNGSITHEGEAYATLNVPAGTKTAYAAADGWKNFKHVAHWSTLVTLTASNHGSIVTEEATASNGSEQYRQPKNDAIIYTLNADTGYELTALTDNAAAVSPLPALGEAQTRTNTSGEEFVTLNATFSAIEYDLTLTLNDGTASNPETYTIETETFTLNNPTKTGYDFAGWKLNGVGDAMMTVTIAQGSTGNLAYTATWTPTIYNIVYTMDDGTATPANPTTYTIETPTFTLTNPTKTGYTFKGWKLNGEGDAMMPVTITQGSTGDKAYTATWQVNQYTITFNSNGGSAIDPITLDYGSTVTPPDEPTKSGYNFGGWTPALPETMPAENITVTAIWTVNTYTVSITGAGVTADKMNPEDGDDVVITIAEDEDRTLNTLTVNGEDVTAYVVDGQYTIHNVTGNVVVVATFNATKEFITLAQGVGTFSCSQDLNFTGSELKAYIAAGYNKSTNVTLLVRVYDVPAGTGLYLKGGAGVTYKIPYSTSQAYYVNMLKANLEAGSIAKTSGDMSNFLLSNVDGVYMFRAPSKTSTLGAQKAYLQLPTSFVPASARAISLAFEDDETTNINDFEMFTNSNDRLYNLKGQRIEKAGRGIYIKNGKKVVIK